MQGKCRERRYHKHVLRNCRVRFFAVDCIRYLAPEVLTGKGYGKDVDWWSLGVLFYEMINGLPPFYSEDTNVMYQRILGSELVFPEGRFSRHSESLSREVYP